MRMQLEREPNWVWEADNLELFQVEHLPRPHLSAHAGRVQIKSRSAALWLPREEVGTRLKRGVASGQ